MGMRVRYLLTAVVYDHGTGKENFSFRIWCLECEHVVRLEFFLHVNFLDLVLNVDSSNILVHPRKITKSFCAVRVLLTSKSNLIVT